ncbi:toxin-antitoxin system, toxin component, RelE family protein [Nostoc linckia z18]|uniref:Toxin-antitoxin system, toxin component, RelE family protein n=2 Tax=Nostoc linckia TaxID=92942 RepID=A0A9Q5ZGP8_NOSLI|nr:type II toxin-antitoxin system RelE/ParE family toxin [Nostoc linckia]PHK42357.1 toxin-antitoxin system, toxin component, RelE family protein [Nostoc linckia z15]PHK46798.1 toxin-antitoxin system, toxin component, RelE family protein [Nostoc linckia z16]PHJ69127.1 toxin-antitoxin system, toxin component, RelE family protein [Nostoc linckia z1]PHJ73278.1 toxin-antitoxin system, toxin component, RelE family protein [Nostoc linckia z3]PHJ78625.1 toxin-antitoxin system, toxin component, RelE fa
MEWTVKFHDDFEPEFDDLPEEVQDELFAQAVSLEEFGPQLGRPKVDTLKGSKHPNMKELRFKAADGVWRVAFAFDPKRNAILLVAGDKSGGSESHFYKQLINKADARFTAHLAQLRQKKG